MANNQCTFRCCGGPARGAGGRSARPQPEKMDGHGRADKHQECGGGHSRVRMLGMF